MDILEKQVVPLYYARDNHGHSVDWVRMSKATMRSLIPRFNAQRMVSQYALNAYQYVAEEPRLAAVAD
jgi:glycogen phosphorylase